MNESKKIGNINLEYKGYVTEIEFDEGDQIVHGRVPGIEDVITFEGKTEKELEKEFIDSIEAYLDFCKNENKEQSKPTASNIAK